MSDFRADPRAMRKISEGYRTVAGAMDEISGPGKDRLALLIEACGDDDMGEELKTKLGDPVKKIEEALTSITTVVENQTNVTKGMAAKLAMAENDNIANVHRGLKR
ncbi:hypothetical protein ACFWMR_20845 [Amycolatopsis thailandensis]|uniref:ESX-1 secretion-associated protein n=1 Tax=Amycolatopsis thailandensis TaxID=589330 RepID=A0A229RP65_9PSEU|nr:hypothetical protein [Amycolatopsis thailandensis]OXM48472.1 hypothetical protein CFP71_32415 [Amycolatopsis thailandensis]